MCYGTTAGTAPVSIFTCPSGTTAIAKFIGGGFDGGSAYQESAAFVSYQPTGGPVIPICSCFAFCSSTGGVGALQLGNQGIWQVLLPGDQLLIADDTTATFTLAISGALLEGIAP